MAERNKQFNDRTFSSISRVSRNQNDFTGRSRSAMNRAVLEDDLKSEDEEEIDLLELLVVVRKKLVLLLFILIVFTGTAGAIAKFIIPKTYSSSSSIFLTPIVDTSGVVDYSSQQSNSKLVDNVVKLITQDNVLNEVAKECNLESPKEVREYLSVTNEDETELVTISATTTDPKLSKKIVTTTVETFINKMKDNLNVKNIEVTAKAKLSYEPVGPSLKKYMAAGAAAGLIIDAAYVLIKYLTNNRLKSKEEAEKYLKLPVFCELPEMKE